MDRVAHIIPLKTKLITLSSTLLFTFFTEVINASNTLEMERDPTHKKRSHEAITEHESQEEENEPLRKKIKSEKRDQADIPFYLQAEVIDIDEITDDEAPLGRKKAKKKYSTFEVKESLWHGEGKPPSPGTVERAVELQQNIFDPYIKNGELTDTAENIRKEAKKKYEQKWGVQQFNKAYSVACQYATEEKYPIYRQCAVASTLGSKYSTFEVKVSLWHGEGKPPSPSIVEKAVELQQKIFDPYIKNGELTDTAENIRKEAKLKYEQKWGIPQFNKAYSAACQYATEEKYPIYRQCAVASTMGRKPSTPSTFEVDKNLWHGEGKLPRPSIVEKAVELQREVFDSYIKNGELTDTAQNIRNEAKKKYAKEWKTYFKTVYSAACQYATEEKYPIYRQCAVASTMGRKPSTPSTFKVDESLWHGGGKLPSPGFVEKAIELQQNIFDPYIKNGELTDSAKNIRKKAKLYYEKKWETTDFDQAYSVACQYATEEKYPIYRQCAVARTIGRKPSTFKVDESLWHGEGKFPPSGLVEKAVELQQNIFDTHIKNGVLTDTAENIRKVAKLYYEKKWETTDFHQAYSVACQYATEEKYPIYRQCAVASTIGRKHSTFEVKESLWHGEGKLPRPGLVEKAVELQQKIFDPYIKNGVLTDSAENIRKEAKLKYEQKWGIQQFNKAYSVACQYATEEKYQIYQLLKQR